ncbi:hypothetical protein [Vibrio maritimus]|uniref:hypothetical protein n=1 Tax=Vibrio maritimus TaxID=990268 RepID=UPI003735A1F0
MTTTFEPKLNTQLAIGLLLTRLSIGLVFLMWALDKVLVPEHAMKVFAGFYGLNISNGISILLGALQIAFVLAFVVGYKKNITYLSVLVLHGISTLISFPKYLEPMSNLLFFAAWPMLAACYLLYILKDYDRFTLGNEKTTLSSTPV